MNWYCRVHVLVPYNIKLYTALRSSRFDYRVRRARGRRRTARTRCSFVTRARDAALMLGGQWEHIPWEVYRSPQQVWLDQPTFVIGE